ncbi:MAG: N-acetyltransferase family protein [Pseudomonadota bacterium]
MIREAQREDAQDVAALWNVMIRETLYTFTTEEKRKSEVASLIAQRPKAFWVASQAGRISGFVTFGDFRSGPGYKHTVEHSILVEPTAVGTGLAHDLMACAEAGASKLGAHAMIGAISSVNARALRFHKRRGFSQVGRLPEVGRKDNRWLDLVLVQKILSAPAHSR